jgi:hypothetical protein
MAATCPLEDRSRWMTSLSVTPLACPSLGRESRVIYCPQIGRGLPNNCKVTNEALRRALARNVRERMEKDPTLNSGPKLGLRAGLGKSTIQHVLNQDAAATIDTVAALARAFGCQPFELLVDSDAARAEALKRMLG